jgi:demethylmenaquinone methyltransferase/2-methoxy-6-polyprenyl-1,4-benzoquinol methylase
MLELKPGDRAGDVCSGTGDFLQSLRKAVGPEGLLIGLDFCEPMLRVASQKDPGAGRALADACRLPVQSGVFDAVTVGWGIRNVPDIDAAHREICRTLKPGGRFVSIDMAVPRNPIVRPAARFITLTVLPRLGSLFSKKEAYTYLPKSTQTFMTREELQSSMERAGFVQVSFQDLFFGNICMHFGVKP